MRAHAVSASTSALRSMRNRGHAFDPAHLAVLAETAGIDVQKPFTSRAKQDA